MLKKKNRNIKYNQTYLKKNLTLYNLNLLLKKKKSVREKLKNYYFFLISSILYYRVFLKKKNVHIFFFKKLKKSKKKTFKIKLFRKKNLIKSMSTYKYLSLVFFYKQKYNFRFLFKCIICKTKRKKTIRNIGFHNIKKYFKMKKLKKWKLFNNNKEKTTSKKKISKKKKKKLNYNRKTKNKKIFKKIIRKIKNNLLKIKIKKSFMKKIYMLKIKIKKYAKEKKTILMKMKVKVKFYKKRKKNLRKKTDFYKKKNFLKNKIRKKIKLKSKRYKDKYQKIKDFYYFKYFTKRSKKFAKKRFSRKYRKKKKSLILLIKYRLLKLATKDINFIKIKLKIKNIFISFFRRIKGLFLKASCGLYGFTGAKKATTFAYEHTALNVSKEYYKKYYVLLKYRNNRDRIAQRRKKRKACYIAYYRKPLFFNLQHLINKRQIRSIIRGFKKTKLGIFYLSYNPKTAHNGLWLRKKKRV